MALSHHDCSLKYTWTLEGSTVVHCTIHTALSRLSFKRSRGIGAAGRESREHKMFICPLWQYHPGFLGCRWLGWFGERSYDCDDFVAPAWG